MAFRSTPWPSRLFDQNFGMCIAPHDYLYPFFTNCNNYYRPWKITTQTVAQDFGSTIKNEKELFKVTLDVQHFLPNELSVKVANGQIIVEGNHEERKDEHGFVARHFTRRYALPSSCSQEDVTSTLSSDGVLTVIAKKSKELTTNEKMVPLTLCKSCPLKGDATKSVINVDKKNKSADLSNVDANKKNTQIMLKEDHCCLLLKPELLREAASDSSEIIVEKKKEKLEQEKIKNTSEMLEQTFAKASAVSASEQCDRAMPKSEIIDQKKSENLRATTSAASAKASASMSSGEVLEESFAKSFETMSASEEKFDLFDSAAKSTTEEILQQTIEKSSAAMSEKAVHSRMTKSEMSELTSTSVKTSESIEGSSSYKASTTSNIKEISEELSDFVCDILCSELDKSLDIKK